MENLLLTICFFLSLFGTFVFIGKLLTWMSIKIAPQSFERGFTNGDIFIANLIGILSCIGWTILFYFIVLKR